jgi:hypothetical protein
MWRWLKRKMQRFVIQTVLDDINCRGRIHNVMRVDKALTQAEIDTVYNKSD